LHPIAGQGFNLGLRDVATLADVLAKEQYAGKEIGSSDSIQRYFTYQKQDQMQVADMTNRLVRVFSNRITPLSLLRNLGLLTLDAIPPLKRTFAKHMTGLRGYPSRLVRGLPLL
jgi:2-octaprenyl-6-methoxyphenol hydroxylase